MIFGIKIVYRETGEYMKKVIISLVIIVILAIGFFAGYRYLYKKADGEFKLTGQLQVTSVDVAFKVPGTIAKQYFSEGMDVKQGQVLAELNNEVYIIEQKLAQANEDTAKWGLEELKAGLKKSGVSNKNLVEKTQSQLEAAKANKELADLQLSYTKITSPINGVILSSYKEEGEVIQAGLPVFSIGDINRLWLRAYLPETKAGSIKLGQKMKIKVDSFPDKTFEGKVTFISDSAEFTPKQIYTAEERVKLVYRVKIEIIDTKGLLKPGIPADAYIEE